MHAQAAAPFAQPAGVYVHVPFCERKCPYCDFYSVADPSLLQPFLDALYEEIRLSRAALCGADSIYIGGGTPSLLDPRCIASIIETLSDTLAVSAGAEVTLEVNPGTVDGETLRAYRQAGVNRLSIGVQSFQDHLLEALGRIHCGKTAETAVSLARAAGFDNIGLDLIFGIPGQTRTDWQTDLDRAAALRPDHLSCYLLTCEAGTPLARAVEAGHTVIPDDALSADLMKTAIRTLTGRGFLHYEISNYPVSPEKASRHNSKYWSFAPYLGLGPSAHSFLPPVRRWNHADIRRYAEDIGAGKLPLSGEETLSRRQQMMETIYLGLRTAEGIDLKRFHAGFGIDFRTLFPEVLDALVVEKMIHRSASRCRLTRKGILFHEGVARRLIGDMED